MVIKADYPDLGPAALAQIALLHRQKTFLDAYSRLGIVVDAAEVAQIERQSHYDWLDDPDYRQRWELAQAAFNDRLLGKGLKAVMAADERDLLYHPNAWMFTVKGRMPEYRDNTQINVSVTNQIATLADAKAAVRLLREASDGDGG